MPMLFGWTKEKFKEWRLDHDLTQDELGYLIGVHYITISKMERGLLSCTDIEFGLKRLIDRAEIAQRIIDKDRVR